MEKTLNMSFVYGGAAGLALLLVCGYCALVRKKELWLILLYISVFVANLGYFALSISKNLSEALLANRIAYLGCVFLPLFMLMTIVKVCRLECPKWLIGALFGASLGVLLLAASPGYLDVYYKDVSLVFVNGMAKLEKEYGRLHGVYLIYLLAYLAIMIGTICISLVKKKLDSYKHAALLMIVVFLNIAIWLVEQLIHWDFEFLSISYIASELLLLFLYGMIQDYEQLRTDLLKNREAGSVKPMHVSEIQLQEADSVAEAEKPPDVREAVKLEQRLANWTEAEVLSARELEVLRKLLQDKKRKEIAEELFITENTVKKHITSIFAKLNVTNRNELFEKIRGKQD